MAQWAITASRVGGGESTPRISDAVTRVERARGDPWAPQRDTVPNTRDDGRRSSLRRLDRTSRRARRTAGRTRDWVWRGRGTGTGSLVGHGTRGAGGTAQRSEREDRAQSLRGQSGGARPLKPPTRRAPTRRRSGAVGAERSAWTCTRATCVVTGVLCPRKSIIKPSSHTSDMDYITSISMPVRRR